MTKQNKVETLICLDEQTTVFLLHMQQKLLFHLSDMSSKTAATPRRVCCESISERGRVLIGGAHVRCVRLSDQSADSSEAHLQRFKEETR